MIDNGFSAITFVICNLCSCSAMFSKTNCGLELCCGDCKAFVQIKLCILEDFICNIIRHFKLIFKWYSKKGLWLHFQVNYNKGKVHPKMKIVIFSPSICSKPVWISFSCWMQKKIFWRMFVTKQLTVAIDFHSMKKSTYFVFSRRKKLIQVWNKWSTIFILSELSPYDWRTESITIQ